MALWMTALIVNHYLPKLGGHKHCGSGDMTFLVAEEENPRWSHFSLGSLFISKRHDLKAQVYHAGQSEKNLKVIFASLSINGDEKEKKEKQEIGNELRVCVLNLLSQVSILPGLVTISLVIAEI